MYSYKTVVYNKTLFTLEVVTNTGGLMQVFLSGTPIIDLLSEDVLQEFATIACQTVNGD